MYAYVMSLFCWFFVSSLGFSFAEPSFVIDSQNFDQVQLNTYILGNFDHRLTEAELQQYFAAGQFTKQTHFDIKFGQYFTYGYRIDNHLPYPVNTFIKLLGRMAEGQVGTLIQGKLRPWQPYPIESDVYSSEVPPGTSIIIVSRMGGGNLSGKARGAEILDFNSIAILVNNSQRALAMIGGAAAIMILYNLGMWIIFRKNYFIFYVIFCLCTLYSLSMLLDNTDFNAQFLNLRTTLSAMSLLWFCKSMLSIDKKNKIMNTCFYGVLIIQILNGLWGWFTARIEGYFMVCLPISVILYVTASVQAIRRGFRPALNLLFGWGAFALGLLLAFLNFQFFGQPFLDWSALYGFGFELCFFAFANSQNARFTENKALDANIHAYNQLKKVFYPHQIEMMKQGTDLEKTMPTGRGLPCVICFDIIGSSRIKHAEVKSFLEASLKQCLGLVSKNYNPTTLEARAYRIKEMGDGFLCSVGFPFKIPARAKVEDEALLLALDFVKEFQSVVLKFFAEPHFFCSIGIAIDDLEGYFPSVGTIEYDVRGRAIILATRYESERKALFPEGFEGHIITLQHKVFQGLSPKLQQEFTVVDLDSRQMHVRDDSMATQLAFRIIKAQDQVMRAF